MEKQLLKDGLSQKWELKCKMGGEGEEQKLLSIRKAKIKS